MPLAVLLLPIRMVACSACTLSPANLTIDYYAPSDVAGSNLSWADPSSTPRFSWQLKATAAAAAAGRGVVPRGLMQAGYQLQVERLAGGSSKVKFTGLTQNSQVDPAV
jgi:hypothetical protein